MTGMKISPLRFNSEYEVLAISYSLASAYEGNGESSPSTSRLPTDNGETMYSLQLSHIGVADRAETPKITLPWSEFESSIAFRLTVLHANH